MTVVCLYRIDGNKRSGEIPGILRMSLAPLPAAHPSGEMWANAGHPFAPEKLAGERAVESDRDEGSLISYGLTTDRDRRPGGRHGGGDAAPDRAPVRIKRRLRALAAITVDLAQRTENPWPYSMAGMRSIFALTAFLCIIANACAAELPACDDPNVLYQLLKANRGRNIAMQPKELGANGAATRRCSIILALRDPVCGTSFALATYTIEWINERDGRLGVQTRSMRDCVPDQDCIPCAWNESGDCPKRIIKGPGNCVTPESP